MPIRLKILLWFTICMLSRYATFAQNTPNDSLKRALKNAHSDSVRFNRLMDLGWEYAETNRDTALYFHDQAFRLAKKNADALDQAWALWGKGYELTQLGKFPEALVCFQEGLKLAEDPANEKNCWYGRFDLANVKPHALRIAAIANLHHNFGHLMGATGNTDEQITHYRISKALASGIGLNFLIGQTNMVLGSVYLQLNQLDSALMFEQNAERIATAPGAYRKYLGFVYRTLGQVYLKKQNKALAFKYFHKGIIADLDQKNLSGVADGYFDLTDYYLGKKQKDSSLYYATRELDVLRSMKSKDLDQAYGHLYQSYKLAGKTDSAYKYQGLALKAKDSVFTATTKSLTDFQKLSFKAQLHAQDLEKEKEAIQTKIRTSVLLAGIGLLMLLAGIFYRNNRQKQKANVLLNRQKDEIEAQARESQIEAALERVRSRTMAMQKSDELAEVIQVIYDQFALLNFNISAANFSTDFLGVKDEYTFWVASANLTYPARLTVPPFDHPAFNTLIEAKESGADHAICNLTTDETKQFWGHFFKNTSPLPEYPPEIHDRIYNSPGYYSYTAIIKTVSLSIINYSGYAYTESEEAVIMRFGKVFAQTYTRFKDLEQAEEQAREAKIEAALERVRSRTMAMQKSDELREVIQLIFDQFVLLNFNINAANFSTDYLRGDDNYNVWLASSNRSYPARVSIPCFDHPVFNNGIVATDKGSDHYVVNLTAGERKQWWDHFFKNASPLPDFPREIRDRIYNAPGYYSYSAIMKTVSFTVVNYQGYAYTESEQAVVMRFGKVFDQTYTRFKDLEQAEEQAREAKIEAALEKVRSRSLAMNKAEELHDIVNIVFKKMMEIGFDLDSINIAILDEKTKSSTHWIAVENLRYVKSIQLPYHDNPINKDAWEAFFSGVDYFAKVFSFEEKNQFYNWAFEHTDFKYVHPDRKAMVLQSESYAYSIAFGKVSFIQAVSYSGKILTEKEGEVLKRFERVFEQAYVRFQDLQKAEERARETVIRASLDRVRGEIASMRTTKDLERIIPLVWNELTILGIPFIRCGVFIGDEQLQCIHTHLSTPDGRALATFDLPFDSEGIGEIVLPAWRNNQIATVHWTAEQFAANTKNLLNQGAVTSKERFVTEHPDTSLDLHFFPFLQGMLYVGNTEPLTDDAMDLVASLAEAFSTAYARYEDFNKLEAAKQQVDQTLTELKSAQKQLIQTEKMASLGELTAGIAHEIQNPLNFVNNFSEVNKEMLEELKAESKKPKAKRDEQLEIELINNLIENEEKISHHGKRADSIVKGMLEHSRSGSGQKEPTNINQVADEYLRLSYHGLRAKDKSFNAELVTHFDPTLPKANVIPQDIGRVLLNLFNNAFYAVNQKSKSAGKDYKPEVSVTTSSANGQVVITVKDNGTGMPDAIKEKIMQPFFTTKPTGEGTGLGLSLTYDMVVKGHGGSIQVNSVEGEGSEFLIQLPIN